MSYASLPDPQHATHNSRRDYDLASHHCADETSKVDGETFVPSREQDFAIVGGGSAGWYCDERSLSAERCWHVFLRATRTADEHRLTLQTALYASCSAPDLIESPPRGVKHFVACCQAPEGIGGLAIGIEDCGRAGEDGEQHGAGLVPAVATRRDERAINHPASECMHGRKQKQNPKPAAQDSSLHSRFSKRSDLYVFAPARGGV